MKLPTLKIPKNKQVWIITILAFSLSLLLGALALALFYSQASLSAESGGEGMYHLGFAFYSYIIYLTLFFAIRLSFIPIYLLVNVVVFFVLFYSFDFTSKFLDLKRWRVFIFTLLIAIVGSVVLRYLITPTDRYFFVPSSKELGLSYPCGVTDDALEWATFTLEPGDDVVDLLSAYEANPPRIEIVAIMVDYPTSGSGSFFEVSLQDAPNIIDQARERYAEYSEMTSPAIPNTEPFDIDGEFTIRDIRFRSASATANELARDSGAVCSLVSFSGR